MAVQFDNPGPQFTERYEPAVVTSLKDEYGQGRVQIQSASIQHVPVNKCPWAKGFHPHSQITNGQDNSHMESAGSYGIGDIVMVERAFGGGDYTIHGHPGTITDSGGGSSAYSAPAGGSTGPGQFLWSWLGSGNKVPRQKTTYPQDGSVSYNNPGQVQMQSEQGLSDPSVRGKVQKYLQQNFPQFGGKAAKLWGGTHSITQQFQNAGMPITNMIQQLQDGGMSEAQGNQQMAQGLDKLRKELNDSSFGNHLDESNIGSISNASGILGGTLGQLQTMMGQFQQHATMQNQAAANGTMLSSIDEMFTNPLQLVNGQNPTTAAPTFTYNDDGSVTTSIAGVAGQSNFNIVLASINRGGI